MRPHLYIGRKLTSVTAVSSDVRARGWTLTPRMSGPIRLIREETKDAFMCLTAGQVFHGWLIRLSLQPEGKSQSLRRTQRRLASITGRALGLYSQAAADTRTRELPVLPQHWHHADTHHTAHQESSHWQHDEISSDDAQYPPQIFFFSPLLFCRLFLDVPWAPALFIYFFVHELAPAVATVSRPALFIHVFAWDGVSAALWIYFFKA